MISNTHNKCITLNRYSKNKNFIFDDIIGYKEIKTKAKNLSNFDVNILLLGETGVGKELFAGAIHNASARRPYNFVHLNCSTIPSSLLETELFGFRKGAYTDAKESKIGKIESANKGTLFLDEIGNISLEAQAKILRVIEYKDLHRIGENLRRSIDVRFIFATNIDLINAVRENQFREDLYYRVCPHVIYIPPLRSRKRDFPKIIDYYWKNWNRQTKLDIDNLSQEEIEVLLDYEYPGNIRQLIGFLEKIYIFSWEMKDQSRINFIRREMNKIKQEYNFAPLRTIMKKYIKEVVSESKNISEAIKILDIDRKTIKKYL